MLKKFHILKSVLLVVLVCVTIFSNLQTQAFSFNRLNFWNSWFKKSLNQEVADLPTLKDLKLEINKVEIKNDTVKLDFNDELNKYKDSDKIGQVQAVIDGFFSKDLSKYGLPKNLKYEIQVNGQPLFQKEAVAKRQGNNKKVTLSPGHGYYRKDNKDLVLQRSYFNGIVEDFINTDLAIELNSNLQNKGYQTVPVRELDKSVTSKDYQYPIWQLGAAEYLKYKGQPESIWNNQGVPGATNSEINKDVRARPLYSNSVNSDLYISIHNNGRSSTETTACGTETWYDTTNASRYESRRLAYLIQQRLVNKIRSNYKSDWCDRGVKGSDGGYGEIRMSKKPAVLIELGYMDNESDNKILQDAKFRTIATQAISDAIEEYTNTDLWEAESDSGISKTNPDMQASNGFMGLCVDKCKGLAATSPKIYNSDEKSKSYQLRYSVKVDQASITDNNPKLPLFDLEVATYTKDNKLVDTKTKEVTLEDYYGAFSQENNGYKDLYMYFNSPENGGTQYLNLQTKGNATISIDKAELVETSLINVTQTNNTVKPVVVVPVNNNTDNNTNVKAKFSLNDNIKSIVDGDGKDTGLSVRSDACGNIRLGRVAKDTKGEVVANAINIDNCSLGSEYKTWYKIKWSNGTVGWSAENFIEKI
jgi:N-acetylmuramoyl-L-alanine amidase